MAPSVTRKRTRDTKEVSEAPMMNIVGEITTIQDLIDLIKMSPPLRKKNREGYFASGLLRSLENLRDMVGLEDVKTAILSQLIYFLQGLHDGKLDMLHTVIQGPPGVGKTELAKILGEIYANLGVLKSGRFVIARRSDLIGKYLGHTAEKTQSVIDSCNGGVLLIDEAYSLGNNGDSGDSFAKECLDTLNQNLTENKTHFMCIIAGYEKALNDCFFSANEGLTRRFTFKYTLNGYKSEELSEIFRRMVKRDNWKVSPNISLEGFFRVNKESFPNFGGDVETLYLYTKLRHARRLMALTDKTNARTVIFQDVNDGFMDFKNARAKSKGDSGPPMHMYL